MNCRNSSKHRIKCLSRSPLKMVLKWVWFYVGDLRSQQWGHGMFNSWGKKSVEHLCQGIKGVPPFCGILLVCRGVGLLSPKADLLEPSSQWNVSSRTFGVLNPCELIPWEINLINLCLIRLNSLQHNINNLVTNINYQETLNS